MDYDLILIIMLLACAVLAMIVILTYTRGKKGASKSDKAEKKPDAGTSDEPGKSSSGADKEKSEEHEKEESGKLIIKAGKKETPKKESGKKEYETKVLYINPVPDRPVMICEKCGCENALGSRVCSVCREPLNAGR